MPDIKLQVAGVTGGADVAAQLLDGFAGGAEEVDAVASQRGNPDGLELQCGQRLAGWMKLLPALVGHGAQTQGWDIEQLLQAQPALLVFYTKKALAEQQIQAH